MSKQPASTNATAQLFTFSSVLSQDLHRHPARMVIDTCSNCSLIPYQLAQRLNLTLTPTHEPTQVCIYDGQKLTVTHEADLGLFVSEGRARLHLYVLPCGKSQVEHELISLGMDWLQDVGALIDFKAMRMVIRDSDGVVRLVCTDGAPNEEL